MDNRVDSILKKHFESQTRDKLLLLLVTPNVGLICLLSVIFTALVSILLLIECVVTNYLRYVGRRRQGQRVRHGRGGSRRGRRDPKPHARGPSVARSSLRRSYNEQRRVPKGDHFSIHPSFQPIEPSRPINPIPNQYETDCNESTVSGLEAESHKEQYESWHTIWDSRETIG